MSEYKELTEVLLVLIKAKELIKDEDNWTREVHARNIKDMPVDTFSNTACKFCVLGAIHRVCGSFTSGGFIGKTSGLLAKSLPDGPSSVWEYNDFYETTHKDILELFDKGINSIKVKLQEVQKNEG